jgi:acetyl-CoA C-acetyltransferase
MEAYILDVIRTPRGAAKANGALQPVKPIDLIAMLYRELQERSGLDSAAVDDIVLGCVTQTGEQGANIARIAALYAGWDDAIPGVTLNRFCASGLDAINYAALKVSSGLEQLVVAGGVESVSRVPMFSDAGAWFADPQVSAATRFVHMGVAADLLATLESFERAELDAYAVQSHQRAARARDSGAFARSLVPVRDLDGGVLLDRDELIRDDMSLERLARLEPSFAALGAEGADQLALERYPQIMQLRHLHHRGNSPALADGAAVALVGDRAKADQLGLRPRARIRSFANHAVEPILMLTAAQAATERALQRAGLTVDDIDLFEFNEGFAATVLKFLRDLRIDPERLNVNGGTIAMGHALGATGGMLIATLLDELERRDLQFGLAAISGGAGLGVATVIERV